MNHQLDQNFYTTNGGNPQFKQMLKLILLNSVKKNKFNTDCQEECAGYINVIDIENGINSSSFILIC